MSHVSAPQDLVISAAIMAGFLPAAEGSMRTQINEQLAWLYENDVCAYEVALPGGARPKGPSISDVTHHRVEQKSFAKFSDTCSVRAGGLCISYPKLVGSMKAGSSNMQELFCSMS